MNTVCLLYVVTLNASMIRGPIFFCFYAFLMKICVRNVLNFNKMRFRWILRRINVCWGSVGYAGRRRYPSDKNRTFYLDTIFEKNERYVIPYIFQNLYLQYKPDPKKIGCGTPKTVRNLKIVTNLKKFKTAVSQYGAVAMDGSQCINIQDKGSI